MIIKFYNFIVNSMERELIEECGIRINKNSKHLFKTIVIGYCRLLNRGGKPEFFGITYIDYEADKLKIRLQERKFISYIKSDVKIYNDSVDGFLKGLDEFINKNSNNFSVQLHIHLLFLKDYIRNYSEEFLKFVNGEDILNKDN